MQDPSATTKRRTLGFILAWIRRGVLAFFFGVIVGGTIGLALGAAGSFVHGRVQARLIGGLESENYGRATEALSFAMLYATLGMVLGAVLGAVLELVLRRGGIRRASTLLGWLAMLVYGVIGESVPFMLTHSPGGLFAFLSLMIPGALLAGLLAVLALEVLGVDKTLISPSEGAAAGFLVGASVILSGDALSAMVIGGGAYGTLGALRILEA